METFEASDLWRGKKTGCTEKKAKKEVGRYGREVNAYWKEPKVGYL